MVFRTASSVTTVSFSKANPSLLAAGMFDGTVAVYDVRSDKGGASVESDYSDGKHSDAVWQVVWVARGAEKGESLVSVSTDGRVSEWSMKKGLTHAGAWRRAGGGRRRRQQRSRHAAQTCSC